MVVPLGHRRQNRTLAEIRKDEAALRIATRRVKRDGAQTRSTMDEIAAEKRKPLSVTQPGLNENNKKGDWAELVACAWLLEQGFDVFRNVSCVGPVDLIALRGGETTLVDVKLCSVKTDHGRLLVLAQPLADTQITAGIQPLHVTKDGICGFSYTVIKAKYEAMLGLGEQRERQAKPLLDDVAESE